MSISILNPALAHVSPTLAALGPEAQSMTVPDYIELFSEGQPCQGFPLVLRGEVRVARRAADGRHLELYRVVPGELCLISSAALFRSQAPSAHGVSTQESELVMVSPATFALWLANALLGRGQDLHLSHQALADELGTVREMVTRLLRRFEREGWLTLRREHIHILNSQALRALAGGG